VCFFFRHRFSNWVFRRRRRCRFFVCVYCFDLLVLYRIDHDLAWDWIVYDARSSYDIFFADNAHFDDDDDDVLDIWLRVWLNFVKKRIRNKNKNDDDHNKRWFFRNRAIDANIQKSIDRVFDVFSSFRLVRHDLINLSIMLAILLEFRVKIQMKVQNEKIIIDRHVDNHSSNVLHCHFKSSNVIRDVLIIDESDDSKFDQKIV
jgi:hypothetical protein